MSEIRSSEDTKNAKHRGKDVTPRNINSCEQPYSAEALAFFEEQGVEMFHIEIPPLQDEDDLPLEYEHLSQGLEILIDKRNHPIYVHCLDGADVTALMIAALRLLMTWTSSSIAAELSRYLRGAEISRDQVEFLSKFKGPVRLPRLLSSQSVDAQDMWPSWLWSAWKGNKSSFSHPFITLIGRSARDQTSTVPKPEANSLRSITRDVSSDFEQSNHSAAVERSKTCLGSNSATSPLDGNGIEQKTEQAAHLEAARHLQVTETETETGSESESEAESVSESETKTKTEKGTEAESGEEDLKFSQTIEALNLEGL